MNFNFHTTLLAAVSLNTKGRMRKQNPGSALQECCRDHRVTRMSKSAFNAYYSYKKTLKSKVGAHRGKSPELGGRLSTTPLGSGTVTPQCNSRESNSKKIRGITQKSDARMETHQRASGTTAQRRT